VTIKPIFYGHRAEPSRAEPSAPLNAYLHSEHVFGRVAAVPLDEEPGFGLGTGKTASYRTGFDRLDALRHNQVTG
jgi:hypothetical protein